MIQIKDFLCRIFKKNSSNDSDISVSKILNKILKTKSFLNPFEKYSIDKEFYELPITGDTYVFSMGISIEKTKKLCPIPIKEYSTYSLIETKCRVTVYAKDYDNHYKKGFYYSFKIMSKEIMELLNNLEEEKAKLYNELYHQAFIIIHDQFQNDKINDVNIQHTILELLNEAMSDLKDMETSDIRKSHKTVQEELEFIRKYKQNRISVN